MKPRIGFVFLTLALGVNIALHAQACPSNSLPPRPDWPVYGGQPEGDHYSGLSQITRSNVGRLKEAWKYDSVEDGGLETNPIVVDRTLFAYTASQKVIALEASTGKLLWKFDSGLPSSQPARGLAYWSDGKQGRVLAGVMYYLYALDAVTGKPIASFGEQGRIDLRKNLRGDYLSQSVVLTSPGIIYQDLIIVGGRNPETYPSPPGDIRAFDVKTGSLRWTFHTIPHPGEFGYASWPADAWKTAGQRTTGQGWRSIRGEALSMFLPDLRYSIFMEPTVRATICSQTRCSRSMQGRASVFGIFKESIMTFGIGIFLHPRLCSR